MKYKYIKISFVAALILSIAVRFIQLFTVTEEKTGFFMDGKQRMGILYLFLLFVCVIAFATCAALVARCPLKTPRVSKPLGAVSIIAAAFTLIEAITYITQVSLFNWEKLLLGVTGPATAIFLVLYGIKGFKNYPLPRPLYAVPIFYYLARLICEFISVSKTALIFQNALNLASIALVLIFMLEWGKIANNIASEISYKTILISGGLAVLLCGITAIPELVFLSVKKNAVPHQNPISLVNLIVMGTFIAFYIYRHFKGSNLEKKHKSETITSTTTDGSAYYVGGEDAQ